VIIYVLDIEIIQNSSALATAKDIGTNNIYNLSLYEHHRTFCLM